jgi:hypothetical protein
MSKNPFFQQVNLLLRVLPYIMEDDRFALKGGSAINLFWREMPRLSIDIDLTYLVIEDRETTVNNISNILFTVLRSKIPRYSHERSLTEETVNCLNDP